MPNLIVHCIISLSFRLVPGVSTCNYILHCNAQQVLRTHTSPSLPPHTRAQVGLRYGLDLLSPVDDAGVFTAEAGPELAGLPILVRVGFLSLLPCVGRACVQAPALRRLLLGTPADQRHAWSGWAGAHSAWQPVGARAG